MPTQKWCSVRNCYEFTFTKIDDFDEINWSAFQIGKGKIRCYCPKHQKECKERMLEAIKNGAN